MAGQGGEVVVKLSADDFALLASAKKIDAQMKQTAKSAGKIGEELGKSVGNLAKSIIGAGALKKIIDGVGESIVAAQKKSAELSRDVGKGAITRAAIARDLFGEEKANAGATILRGRGGVTTEEENLKFARELADATKDRPLEARESIALLQAFKALGPELGKGLIEGAKRGEIPTMQDVKGRIAALPSDARLELAIREREMEMDAQRAMAEEMRANSTNRFAEAARATRDAENPGAAAFRDFVQGALPVGGSLVEAGDRALNGAMAGASDMAAEVEKGVRAAQPKQLNLSAGGERAP